MLYADFESERLTHAYVSDSHKLKVWIFQIVKKKKTLFELNALPSVHIIFKFYSNRIWSLRLEIVLHY